MGKVYKDIISGLKEYLNSHTEEEIAADIEKLNKWREVGPTMEEFEKAQQHWAVPYQLCPKCGGTGKVLDNNQRIGCCGISSGVEVCDVCHGSKIIPMHNL
jgi:hypothetical protein